MNKDSRILVLGHTGMVGSALVRRLRAGGYDYTMGTFQRVDLRSEIVANRLMDLEPDYVVLAAAKVGGIMANSTRPAEFIRDNLAIQTNVIHAAMQHKVKGFVFLGSSCVYPRDCPQPIREEYLGTGPLEPTNSAYATAKLAGIEMVRAYRRQYGFPGVCVMPCNLYGPGDNYDPHDAHVLPAMIAKFHEAKERGESSVTLWGTGTPRREFLYVDDLADAVVRLMEMGDKAPELVNVGSGSDETIESLAFHVSEAIGFDGVVMWDATKPNGTPRKLLDVSKMNALGWKPRTTLVEGIRLACQDYRGRLELRERQELIEVRG